MQISKLDYEKPSLELISLCPEDVITSSGAFDGEDDVFDLR